MPGYTFLLLQDTFFTLPGVGISWEAPLHLDNCAQPSAPGSFVCRSKVRAGHSKSAANCPGRASEGLSVHFIRLRRKQL